MERSKNKTIKSLETHDGSHIDNSDNDKEYEDNYAATRDILGYYPPECPQCGATMKFNFLIKVFRCFSCGFTIGEDDIDLLLDENGEYEDIYAEINILDDDEEMPECCKACGGPWPKCKISCKLFDD